MSYPQAFKIAWSLFWRQVTWAFAILACLFVMDLLVPLDIRGRMLGRATAMAFLLAYFLIALPSITRQLTEIRYSDFRVALRRSREGPLNLTYNEAVLLALLAEVLTDISAGLALALCFLVAGTINRILPGSSIPTLLAALALALPLKAAILLWIPAPGFRLEVLNDFECDLPDPLPAS